MKDMPAVLLASLAGSNRISAREALKAAFPLVIDNGKMVRNFVQAIRSGQFGRRGLGTSVKKLVAGFVRSRSPVQLLKDSIGNDPSLVDVIRLAHPRPVNEEQNAAFKFFLGLNPEEGLHPVYKDLRAVVQGQPVRINPMIPWELLVSCKLTDGQWKEIARMMGWHALRMNLNTLQRHGVLQDAEMVEMVAGRLGDPEELGKARVMPYQIMTAYQNLGDEVPTAIRSALHRALDAAVPRKLKLPGLTALCVDVSGSMSSPVTGHRKGATTKTKCVDVAALIAGVICKSNPDAMVVPFDTQAHPFRYVPEDSVLTNAQRLAEYGGGGTACVVALQEILTRCRSGKSPWPETIIYVSDNQSWADFDTQRGWGTRTMELFLAHFPQKTRLVLIDLQPYTTTQASSMPGRVLNVGGFNDSVFEVIRAFTEGKKSWVQVIKAVSLDGALRFD